MAGKMVIVLSFDEPADPQEKHDLLEEVIESFRPVLNTSSNHHTWLGVGDAGAAVLNVIGVD